MLLTVVAFDCHSDLKCFEANLALPQVAALTACDVVLHRQQLAVDFYCKYQLLALLELHRPLTSLSQSLFCGSCPPLPRCKPDSTSFCELALLLLLLLMLVPGGLSPCCCGCVAAGLPVPPLLPPDAAAAVGNTGWRCRCCSMPAPAAEHVNT